MRDETFSILLVILIPIILMYKYKETFEELYKTITEADKAGLSDDEVVKTLIKKALDYPYNEIAKGADIRDVTEGLVAELRILEGLEKIRREK